MAKDSHNDVYTYPPVGTLAGLPALQLAFLRFLAGTKIPTTTPAQPTGTLPEPWPGASQQYAPPKAPGSIVWPAMPANPGVKVTEDGMLEMDMATFKQYTQAMLADTAQKARNTDSNMLAEILKAGGS